MLKEVGRIGRWVLRLAPFKFRVVHTKGSDNLVADALSRVFEGQVQESPEAICGAILESLPLVYSSLEEHQMNDAWCKDMKQKVINDVSGTQNFKIRKNLLCFQPKGANRCRWVVLSILKSMLLKYFHDCVLAGHLEAFKTYRKIANNFWWPGMRAEVFSYVRKCDLCQRAKPAQDMQMGLHVAQPPSRPMEKVFIDFVGPLTRTRRGNNAILAILDGFSKFVIFYPVRKISSQVVVEYLERNYFPMYGIPHTIVTDNASVFRSKPLRAMCFRWAVNHVTNTPYYPQANLVVRANRNLKSALKIFHHSSQTKWDEDLPLLNVAFNTAIHESSKSTPDVLFLGREIKCPLSSRWDFSSNSEMENAEANHQFWARAYENLKTARDKVARRYNANRRAHQYKEGNLVVFKKNVLSSKAQNITNKMSMRWSEPVVISKIVNVNNLLLANPNTGVVVRRAHVSQAKPYHNYYSVWFVMMYSCDYCY